MKKYWCAVLLCVSQVVAGVCFAQTELRSVEGERGRRPTLGCSAAEGLYDRIEQANSDYEMGMRYYNGEGVMQDYQLAREWFEKTAIAYRWPLDAMFYLGRIYQYGQGVEPDVTVALYWYGLACNDGFQRGHEEACRAYSELSE